MDLNCDRLAAIRTGHFDAIKSSLALLHCARETSAQLAQLSANVVADKLKWQHSPTSLTFATRFLLFFFVFFLFTKKFIYIMRFWCRFADVNGKLCLLSINLPSGCPKLIASVKSQQQNVTFCCFVFTFFFVFFFSLIERETETFRKQNKKEKEKNN